MRSNAKALAKLAFPIALMIACAPSTLRAQETILSDYSGIQTLIDPGNPCTSVDSPVIFNSEATGIYSNDRKIWDLLRLAMMELDMKGLCRFGPGNWIYFEARTKGVAVRRGWAELAGDYNFTGQKDFVDIAAALPPETALSKAVTLSQQNTPNTLPAIIALFNEATTDDERRDIAFLIGDVASMIGDRTPEEQNLRVEYLKFAADAGHPVAQFKMAQLAGIPNDIYEATANVETSVSAYQRLKSTLPSDAGRYLLASAEAGFAEAVETLDRAGEFGFEVTLGGLRQMDIPTYRNVDAAIADHFAKAFDTSYFPPELQPTRCDKDWCYLFGGSKFRMTVDSADCAPASPLVAVCLVVARYILSSDFADGQSPQDDFLSNTTNTAPIRLRVDLTTDGRKWQVATMEGL